MGRDPQFALHASVGLERLMRDAPDESQSMDDWCERVVFVKVRLRLLPTRIMLWDLPIQEMLLVLMQGYPKWMLMMEWLWVILLWHWGWARLDEYARDHE